MRKWGDKGGRNPETQHKDKIRFQVVLGFRRVDFLMKTQSVTALNPTYFYCDCPIRANAIDIHRVHLLEAVF